MTIETKRRGPMRPITDLPETSDPLTGWLELEKAGTFYKVGQALIGGSDPALAPIGTELADYSSEFGSVPSDWTWLNQGTSTITAWQRRMLITPQPGGAGVNAVRFFGPPSVPAGNWAARTMVGFNSIVANCGGGLMAYRAASGDFTLQSALARGAGTPMSCRLITGYWTDFATFGTVVRDDNPPLLEQRVWFMQTRYDGTLLYFDYSADNAVFFPVASVNAVTAIGGAPTRLGLAANAPAAADGSATSFRWLRVYSGANLNQGP